MAIGSLSSHTPNWFLSPLALQETGTLHTTGGTVTEEQNNTLCVIYLIEAIIMNTQNIPFEYEINQPSQIILKV